MKNMLIEIFKPTPIELTLEELEKVIWKNNCGRLKKIF